MNHRDTETERTKRVAIVGHATTTRDEAVGCRLEGRELWGINEVGAIMDPGIVWGAHFAIDPLENFTGEEGERRLDWLKGRPERVYMQEATAEFPTSVRFPREALVERFGRKFASTASWMMGLAIHEGYQEIAVYGIDMGWGAEYLRQRASMLWLMGYAEGAGITVHVPEGSMLYEFGNLYGFEPAARDDGYWCEWRVREELKRAEAKTKEAERARFGSEGALQMVRHLIGRIGQIGPIGEEELGQLLQECAADVQEKRCQHWTEDGGRQKAAHMLDRLLGWKNIRGERVVGDREF